MKALIIDDEYFFRRMLRQHPVWARLNISVCADAADGAEGLRLAETYQPELILADINMPLIDGLTFIERLRKTNSSAKVIIISGYDNFEYAKQAMRLGVSHYLLKPVRDEELEEVLTQTAAQIRRGLEEKQEYSSLLAFQTQHRQNLQQQFLSRLLTEPFNADDESALQQEAKQCDFLKDCTHYCIAVMASFTNGGELCPLSDKLLYAAKQFLERTQNRFQSASVRLDRCHCCIVLGYAHSVSLNQAVPYAEELALTIEMQDLVTIRLSLSEEMQSLYAFSACCNQALSALYWRNRADMSAVICPHRIQRSPLSSLLTAQLRLQMIACLRMCDQKRLTDLLDSLRNQLRELRISREQLSYAAAFFLSCSAKASQDGGADPGGFMLEPHEQIYTIQNTDELMRLVQKMCFHVMDAIRASESKGRSAVVERAIAYVDLHYSESDLTIETISRACFSNYAYLCCVFKRDIGMTINHYIMKLRIKKALQRIDGGETSVSAVATAVGFSSANYFCKCFKKELGLVPSDYIGKRKTDGRM